VKGGVSPYYSPRMRILNQKNLDYAKYCVVPFGAFVQANHESTKMSSNVTRILDAIYLCLAQNQQGGHELMDLSSGQLISRNIVHKIPVTGVLIKAVKNMAYQQGFKSLKFKNRNRVIYHNADWIAGVDYDDPHDYDLDDIKNENEEYDNNKEDNTEVPNKSEDQLEQIDPEEIKDIIRDARRNTNPNLHDNNANKEKLKHRTEQQAAPEESTRRWTWETRPIKQLKPKMSGKSYMQQQKNLIFNGDVDLPLEYHHNLVTQTVPDEGQSKEYSPSNAMLTARLIYNLKSRVVREGTSSAQQYLLNKGLKIFGQKGWDASKKEIDQPHQRSCFTPKSIAKMTQIEWRKAQQALMFFGEMQDGTV
jgi:hypothetical protein